MEEQKGIPVESPAAKEKIREFCYELALALRRITGKVVENDLAFLEETKETPMDQPNQTETGKDQNENN